MTSFRLYKFKIHFNVTGLLTTELCLSGQFSVQITFTSKWFDKRHAASNWHFVLQMKTY